MWRQRAGTSPRNLLSHSGPELDVSWKQWWRLTVTLQEKKCLQDKHILHFVFTAAIPFFHLKVTFLNSFLKNLSHVDDEVIINHVVLIRYAAMHFWNTFFSSYHVYSEPKWWNISLLFKCSDIMQEIKYGIQTSNEVPPSTIPATWELCFKGGCMCLSWNIVCLQQMRLSWLCNHCNQKNSFLSCTHKIKTCSCRIIVCYKQDNYTVSTR